MYDDASCNVIQIQVVELYRQLHMKSQRRRMHLLAPRDMLAALLVYTVSPVIIAIIGCNGPRARGSAAALSPQPIAEHAPELKVLTWNIFMMPPWTFQSPHNTARAQAVADELLKLDYDVLCLEKAFDGAARAVLDHALASQYPYRYGPANPACFPLTDSGVWVLSRIPFSDYRDIEFADSAGVEVFARKGAMMLSGVVSGHPFQLIATHLQGDDVAAYQPDHQQVRDRQMTQIRAELIARYADPDVPLILCGDFATPRFDPDNPGQLSGGYTHMLATFEAENGPEYRITLDDALSRNDMATDDSGRIDELDYVLLRNGGRDVRGAWTRHVLRHPGWDGPHGHRDLSYRYAVGAVFRFPVSN